jgi:hypothetical protein
MNVKSIYSKYRELKIRIKIQIYQKIADYMILTLASVQQAEDSRFEMIYDVAIRFNEYCVDKEIYLD